MIKMNGMIRFQWPMETYLTAWKTFRRLSNENQATAEHLTACPFWPSSDNQILVDIGCGDGRLLEAVLLCSPGRVRAIRLIDPDLELLQDAATCIQATGLHRHTSSYQFGIEDIRAECFDGASAILIVHVVYLVDAEIVSLLFDRLPPNVPMYIVLDHSTSVFSALWTRTAPLYRQRAADAHALIRNLSDHFRVNSTIIRSTIQNPLTVRRLDVRDAVLSLLTYSDIGPSTDSELREWIAKTIQGRLENGVLPCVSSCYEIMRSDSM